MVVKEAWLYGGIGPFEFDDSVLWDSSATGSGTLLDGVNNCCLITDSDIKCANLTQSSSGGPNSICLEEQSGDPTNVANTGKVYTKDVAALTELFYMDDAGTVIQITSGGAITPGTIDHGGLTGLGDDDHPVHMNKDGRLGGQTLTGSIAAGEDLTLLSTSHATKGKVIFGTGSAYDEVNNRLGVGTQTPQVPLHAEGTTAVLRLSDDQSTGVNDVASYISFYDRNDTAEAGIFGFETPANAHMTWNNKTAAGDLLFATNNTTRMTIDGASGQVGIGETTPNYLLHITGSDNIMALFESSDATGGIRMRDSNSTGDTYVGFDAVTDDLQFVAGDATVGAFISTGLLGVGTSSPQENLHIEGTAPVLRFSDSNSANTTQATGVIEFYHGNNTTELGHIGYTAVTTEDLLVENITSGGAVYLYTNSATGILVLESDGKLGVGTLTPQTAFHLEAAVPHLRIADSNSTSVTEIASIIEFYDRNATARGAYMGFGSAANAHFNIDNETAAGDVILSTNSTARLTIDGASGNVGIGGDPDRLLSVYGTDSHGSTGPVVWMETDTDAFPQLVLFPYTHDNVSILFDAYYDGSWRSADAGSNFAISKVGDRLLLRYDSGIAQGSTLTWNTGFAMEATGHLGIHTANPTFPLHVTGNSKFTADLTVDGELLGSRHTWMFGHNAASGNLNNSGIFLEVSGVTTSAARGVVACRAGSIVGVAVRYDTTASSSPTLDIKIYKNGAVVWTVTGAPVTTGDNKTHSDTQARGTDTFAAEDDIAIEMAETGGGFINFNEVICTLDVVYDA